MAKKTAAPARRRTTASTQTTRTKYPLPEGITLFDLSQMIENAVRVYGEKHLVERLAGKHEPLTLAVECEKGPAVRHSSLHQQPAMPTPAPVGLIDQHQQLREGIHQRVSDETARLDHRIDNVNHRDDTQDARLARLEELIIGLPANMKAFG